LTAPTIYKRWIEIPEWDTAIGVAPKCGARSLLVNVQEHFEPGLITHRRVWFHDRLKTAGDLTATRRIMVVRHPTARFASLYKHKVLLGAGLADSKIRRYLDSCSTPEELWELSLQHKNIHWCTQVEIEAGLSTELVLTEDLSELWATLPPEFEMVIHHRTDSADVNISTELANKILERYAGDLELYERAVHSKVRRCAPSGDKG